MIFFSPCLHSELPRPMRARSWRIARDEREQTGFHTFASLLVNDFIFISQVDRYFINHILVAAHAGCYAMVDECGDIFVLTLWSMHYELQFNTLVWLCLIDFESDLQYSDLMKWQNFFRMKFDTKCKRLIEFLRRSVTQ